MAGSRLFFCAVAIGMVAASAAVTMAQTPPERKRGQGWRAESNYGRLYDPTTIETIAGEIIEVAEFTPREGSWQGVHLMLRTDDETMPVHLGPAWFIEMQDLQLLVTDRISVTGSRVNFDGKPAIVADAVQKGDELMTLRDEDGIPRWSASWERRPRIGRGAGGWERHAQYGRLFNPASVETMTGEVVDVAYFTPPNVHGHGIHLMLKAEQETIPVHLGPAWFVENQELQIQPKDTVSVRGSRVTVDGEMVIIAAEIQKGEDILELRNANGDPRWSGWRRARTGP